MQKNISTTYDEHEFQALIIDCVKTCLQFHLPNNSTQSETADRWLSLDELCEYLPGKPAKSTIYIKVCKRQIPHKKQGSRLYFRKSEIDTWLNGKNRKTVDDIKAEASASQKK